MGTKIEEVVVQYSCCSVQHKLGTKIEAFGKGDKLEISVINVLSNFVEKDK